ncbi:hypothetical protein [Nocardioides pocheonensis]|uniref:Uncharacterized protein n=1 Tax=Nocardioides pocheonensis TaxID=661485 RepID=A0A3N0GS69_9ACTN|nr:hypothetical protein [Nocardioides pocheonensis]RNM14962.1 hypothetical protein EFL26_09610 [Nocardioides pocheonensis]
MPPKLKANPRKQELADALSRARTVAGTIPGILQPAAAAMSAKAWVGGSSHDFEAGLSEQAPAAKKGGTSSVEEIQSAYDRCPAEIPDPTAQDAH